MYVHTVRTYVCNKSTSCTDYMNVWAASLQEGFWQAVSKGGVTLV